MKSKTKSGSPTLREKAAALAVMASEVLLMVLDEADMDRFPGEFLPDPKPTVLRSAKPKTAKLVAKRKGRPPMTEEQRAAAKAERERFLAMTVPVDTRPVPPPKPQPVTRASLAAQNALAPVGTITERQMAAEPSSYFTKVS